MSRLALAAALCSIAALSAGQARAEDATDRRARPVQACTFSSDVQDLVRPGAVLKDVSLKALVVDQSSWKIGDRWKVELGRKQLEFIALEKVAGGAVAVTRREGPAAFRVVGVCPLDGGDLGTTVKLYERSTRHGVTASVAVATFRGTPDIGGGSEADENAGATWEIDAAEVSTDGKTAYWRDLGSATKERARLLAEARTATQRKEYPKAVQSLEGARILSGGDASITAELGWACFLAGDLAAAERWSEQALTSAKAGTQRSMILYNLGRVAEARKNTAGALERYRAALELRPGNKVIQRRIAELAP